MRVDRSWLRVRPAKRCLDKALYEASFAARSFPRVFARARRTDVVVCVVPSLVATALAALASSCGARSSLRPPAQSRMLQAELSKLRIGSSTTRPSAPAPASKRTSCGWAWIPGECKRS